MTDTESQLDAENMRGRDLDNPSVTTRTNTTSLLVTGMSSNHITSIPELYHLTRIENYSSWAFRIKNVLMRDGLFEYYSVPPTPFMDNVERKGRQTALSAINGSIKGDVVLKLLKRYSDLFDCWSFLKSRYESDSTTRQMSLIDKFFSIRKNGSMDAYLADMTEVADQMEEVEVGLPKKVIVYHTLINLPSDYDMLKQVILHERRSPSYLGLEARLLNEEISRKNCSQNQTEALAISHCRGFSRRPFSQGNSGGRHSYGSRSSSSSTVYNQSRSVDSSRTSAKLEKNQCPSSRPGAQTSDTRFRTDSIEFEVCSLLNKVCELESHLQREGHDRQKRTPGHSVHSVETDSGDINTLEADTDDAGEEEFASQVIDAYLAEANILDSNSLSKLWYLDFGATNYVSSDASVFSSLSPRSGTRITSVGGHTHDVTGMGNIVIRLPLGKMQQISYVLYSLGITKNLISIGFLTDKGFTLEFQKSLCLIKNIDGSLIASAIKNSANGLYKLQGETLIGCHEVNSSAPEALALMSQPSKASMWHKRLGHFHFERIRRMLQFGAVRGLPNMNISNYPCSSCLTGK